MSAKSLPGIEETRKAIHQVLRAWSLANPKDLSFFAGFLTIRERGFDERLPPAKKWQLVKQALEECLSQVNDRQPLQGQLLSRRFIQDEGVQQIALSTNLSQDHLNRLQREAMDALAQIWLANEELARSARGENLLFALPPRSYERLFGVKLTEAKLVDLLLEPAAPTLIALTGLGGIGKTALADSVVRTVLSEFVYTSVIWLRAESMIPKSSSFKDQLIGNLAERLLPDEVSTLRQPEELKKAFKKYPHLVILDNLEDEVQDLEWLYLLQDFAYPSKFIFTGRMLPSVFANMHITKITELRLEPATEFLVHHAQSVGLIDQADELPEQAALIYTRTGGNPLALKLTVGLLQAWPLATVLHSLEEGPGSDVEAMYRHIFEANWQTISPDSRQLLQAMLLVSDQGAEIDQLHAISGFSDLALREALKELTVRSLVELRGSLTKPRYGIHRLTDTFLRGQLIRTL